jgi:hypothetical protein
MGYLGNILVVLCIISTLLISGCSQSTRDQVPAPAGTQLHMTTDSPAVGAQSTSTQVTGTGTVLVRGKADPDFIVDVSVPEKIAQGTTLLPDNHNPDKPRIIEVNQLGEIVWEYVLPPELKAYTNPGWDVELLPNGNILTVLPRKGVYEINRDKKVVWIFIDPKVSHDADRLPNGNTLIAYGAMDAKEDAQVREVSPEGKVVWSWHAKDLFDKPPYASIYEEGWTHTNAVSRLDNGNTLISLRNFNFIVEVDQKGNLVRKIGEGILTDQHDPEVLPNGNILLANHVIPNEALELDANSMIVWRFPIRNMSSFPVRDADRLANGNTLITAADQIVEVTEDKEIVWMFRLSAGGFTNRQSASGRGFYKAERVQG